jgi:hypothetical protein
MTRHSPTEPAQFDVRAFARTAQGNLRGDLDLAAFASVPLEPEVLRVLTVNGTLEGATMAHLRNVLVTPTHKDARVTAFLVTWAFEKFWIADALRAIVDANGGDADAAKARAGSRSTAATSGGRGPVGRALAGFLQGGHVVGAHMTAGLVDDWMLRAAYERAVETSANGALDDAVARILAVKERHTRFFQEEAARRLTASPKAVRLARRELRRTAWPLGSVTLSPAARDAFTGFVFAGGEGEALAARVEQQIAGIPGMDARTAAIVREKLADTPAD